MSVSVTNELNLANEEINLIKSILRVTPQKRPTIKEILQNPYFLEEDSASTKESEKEIKEKEIK